MSILSILGIESPEPVSRLRRQFEVFHAANPDVYLMLENICLQHRLMGRRRWSINAAFEVLRWRTENRTGRRFVLDNNFRAFYSRMLMDENPRLQGMFEKRAQRA